MAELNSNVLLIGSPISSFNSIPAGIYVLSSALKKSGCNVNTIDLNILFYRYILNDLFK